MDKINVKSVSKLIFKCYLIKILNLKFKSNPIIKNIIFFSYKNKISFTKKMYVYKYL